MGFGFIAIGPMEVIVVAVGLLTLGLALVVVIILAMSSRRRAAGNLVNCPDCGNGVSTQASACPHCGRPTSS